MKQNSLERTRIQFWGTNTLAFALLLTAGGFSAYSFANHSAPPAQGEKAKEKDGEEADEVTIKLTEAPAAVQAALSKMTPAAGVTKVVKESDEGITVYEVEFTAGGVKSSADFSEAGDVLEIEKSIPNSALSAAATAALKKEFPKATLGECTSVQKMYFEVEMTTDGKKHMVKIDAAGNIDEGHEKKDGDKGKEDKD